MRTSFIATAPAAVFLGLAALAAGTVLPNTADARSAQFQTPDVVNVSVSFNTQVPLSDLSEEALAESQTAGRKFVYRMARDECAVLKSTIARTCRLANLSVGTQVQRPNNRNPVLLYINGNANFAISLKDGSEE
jgi:hypothetical protein